MSRLAIADLAERVRLLRNFGFVGEDAVSGLGINAKIRLVEPKTIERSEGKAKRVIDRRKLI